MFYQREMIWSRFKGMHYFGRKEWLLCLKKKKKKKGRWKKCRNIKIVKSPVGPDWELGKLNGREMV